MSEGKHHPQLDGLRAFAVILVFLHHWTFPGHNLGILGVQLFFVLSGFLITGILLRLKNAVNRGTQSLSFSLRQFYIRRCLRIFPLYYGCLLLFVALDRFEIRETAPWYFLYLANVRFFLIGSFEGMLSHFWTLAVEEQFYLIWPCVVLLFPRRWLKPTLWTLVLLAPITRAVIWISYDQSFAATHTLLPANLDTLGLGALGACWRENSASIPDSIKRTAKWLVPLCLIEIMVARLVDGPLFAFSLLDSTAVAVVSLWLVLGGTRGFPGLVGDILSNPAILYLGRISYGLYIWHMFAPAFLRNLLKLVHLPESWNHGWVGFTLLFSVTVAVSSISWFLLERPLNSLKRFFRYSPAKASSSELKPA